MILDEGETVVTQSGAMAWCDSSVEMSTNAVRFANAFDYNEQDDNKRNNMINATRHVIWLATITLIYGEDIAREIGNAHENDSTL